MIEITLYKCQHCGSVYETENEATRCEDGHAYAEIIEEQEFGRMNQYPCTIRIQMANGKTCKYELRCELHDQ